MTTEEFIKEHQNRCDQQRVKFKNLGIDGPWMQEPDRVEFKYLGFHCLLSRNPVMFNWCGYIGLPPGHPFYGNQDADLYVHGGITFSEECEGHICHIPSSGEPDHLFWFGFDCAHGMDLIPSMGMYPEISAFKGASYKDVGYVTAQVEHLAKQCLNINVPRKTTSEFM